MSAGVEVQSDAAVPLVDLAAQQADVHEEVMAELADVFKEASFIGGAAVALFEAAYASFVSARHCIGVANGTDALELALRAGGVTPGGEVILPANTFIATAEAVSRIGAVPVPVDVDPAYLLINSSAVAAAVTSRTQAIVPVHLFGQTAFVEQLVPLADACGAVIIEDAAQAQGARRFGRCAGTLGLAASTSFYPGKNLGAAGDAGAVLTNDPSIADQVRMLGAHGSMEKYRHDAVGMNSRLDTVQAVVLKAKLERLESWNLLRRAAAERYSELLADVPGVVLPLEAPGNVDVWHLYVVRVPERDAVLAALHSAGIQAGIHYPVPVHLSAAYASAGYGPGSFPVAEEAAGQILSLPIFPHITTEQQERVVEALRAALTGGNGRCIENDR
ncbi:putative PLP-dependent enzyme possibly involved in cell wall biogenesis [Pseudarthrobacter phenanthrenivorans Sphe3]|uniref:Putative PLP-dependent enzyme possibly involved in cell wall biogenesis n=1 Tax=Pseudarthrobacter phenanthrenivorans (strain DSM 18606 / JCM 16027 / LMG 23796 / Sphe3) TaxID=930171 RepID=F0MA42_PSEPM|nr:DegT/DnrJ/EryC1/StrS family aminotransferase [Pseudarthrobacter phenanthrenivorans]ADX75029.1 putative PLP-dependent enzyme possibly involved in cell wall biogenesis [Pseudarthrobacter phenanthrenivorans Sphe3]